MPGVIELRNYVIANLYASNSRNSTIENALPACIINNFSTGIDHTIQQGFNTSGIARAHTHTYTHAHAK